jgi:hypothetical protein
MTIKAPAIIDMKLGILGPTVRTTQVMNTEGRRMRKGFIVVLVKFYVYQLIHNFSNFQHGLRPLRQNYPKRFPLLRNLQRAK